MSVVPLNPLIASIGAIITTANQVAVVITDGITGANQCRDFDTPRLEVIATVVCSAHVSICSGTNVVIDGGLFHKGAKHHTKPRSVSSGCVRHKTGFLMRKPRQRISDIVRLWQARAICFK